MCHYDIMDVIKPGGAAAADDLLYQVIRRLWPLHRSVVRAVERELDGTGITAAQHAVLDALTVAGPQTVPQLARTLRLDRQPVQRTVNEASAAGLVETAPNPGHRRSHLIRLTTHGQATITAIVRFEQTELRRRLSDLSAADITTALHVLDRLSAEFQQLARPDSTAPERENTA
jgi:DNA-binding MarR family transcriptional regulator